MLSGPRTPGGGQSDARSSRVSLVASALQALEVGLPQDAIDLQVGHQARGARRV